MTAEAVVLFLMTPLNWAFAGFLVLLALWYTYQARRHTRRQRHWANFHAMRAEINQLLGYCDDERVLLDAVCQQATSSGGLPLAFISQPTEEGGFRVLAASGALTSLDDLASWPVAELGQPAALDRLAWQAQAPLLVRNLQRWSGAPAWRPLALRHGLRACAALPLHKGGAPWAVLCLFHADVPQGPVAEIRLALQQFATDIGMGLDRLEARLIEQALLENARAGIAMVKGRVIQRCNANCAHMLGYTQSELIGQSARMLYPDEDEFQRVGLASEQMRRDGRVRLHEVRYRTQTGAGLLCDVTGVRLEGSSDDWSVWTIEDVTRRAQQSLRLQVLVQFNALLAAINRLGGQAESVGALFEQVCREAVAKGGMRLAWIGRPDPVSGQFQVLAAHGATDYLRQVTISSRRDAKGGNGPTGIAWRERRPVFAARYRHKDLTAPWQSLAQQYGFGAFAALPLHEHGQLSSVLTVYCQQEDIFDQDTQQVLQALASSIEHGLHDIWQRHRIASLQQLYRALMSEGDVVLQARTASEMLSRTCERLVDGTQFHAVWVGRPDASGQFEVLAGAGAGAVELPALALPLQHPAGRALVASAWLEHKLVFSNDHLSDPQLQPWQTFNLQHQWLASLAAPVLRGGQCWAVLVFVSPQRDVFDSPTVELCQFVTALLGHGLDEMDLKQRLSQLQREEAHRARHDALTGLPNRYALEQHLQHATAVAQRNGTLVALGMIDLDDFKPVNDAWGHEAGDRLLQTLARRLQSALRSVDLLARLGGDEFLLVIEGLDPEQLRTQLQQVMARLHRAVEQPFDVAPGEQVEVGMSLGLALFPSDASDADQLLRQADAAMYQAKLHKHTRQTWWRLASEGSAGLPLDPHFDPYGSEAAQVLGKVQHTLEQVIARFVDAFHRNAEGALPVGDLLACLDDAALPALRQAQSQHLQRLLTPVQTRAQVSAAGLRLGSVHALVGVSSTLLTQSRALFRQCLGEQLNRVLLSAADRYRLLWTVDARLQDDLQAELEAAQGVLDAFQTLLAQPLPSEALQPVEVRQAELAQIGELPGVLACQILRPNAQGVFQVEASAGPMAEAVRQILATPGLQPVFDKREQAGRGVIPLAWRSGNPETCALYGRDPRTATWHHVLDEVPIRSMLVVPIRPSGGDATHVLAIQSQYPNQFESRFMRQFASGLQLRLSTLWHRFSLSGHVSGIEETTARSYREQLFAGGLEMVMQPIVCLRSGRLRKVEALARLRMPDGQIVMPGTFLPLLGNVEYDRLFRLGLDQALGWLAEWDAVGLSVDVAVNLPPNTLLDPACASWVEEALARHGVAPARLHLELLENQSFDFSGQNQAIERLNHLGVHLAMDDLGSGYSSLQRLSALLFHTIKSDQALLARAEENPVQTLSLLGAIIQMGRDFECDVVVEGLEHLGLLEAAALLGAQCGQGYAIARPMAASAIAAWSRQFVLPLEPGRIQTPMGALAYLWQVLHSEGCSVQHAFDDCPLTCFLASCGPDADAAQAWHRLLHQGGERQALAQPLIAWLVEQIKQERRQEALP